MNKTNNLVVISGGTRGIGRAIVQCFAQNKYNIVTCSRNKQELEKLKKELEKTFPIKIHVFKADLSKKKEVMNFAEFIQQLSLSVEVLVNNSGTFVPGLVHEEPDGALENMIETNLYSAYHLSKKLIPQMKERRKGHIFNVCSIASLQAYPHGGSYSISKFAMYGLSKALREEMKNFNVKVTSILPGAVFTDSWKGSRFSEERLMQAKDIADMIYATYKLSNNTAVEDIILRPQLGDL